MERWDTKAGGWVDGHTDLRGFGIRFLAFALGLDFTADDELADVVVFGKAEELADLGGTLGTEAFGVDL